MDFNLAKEKFEEYMSSYDRKDKKINLKYIHTYKVVDLMGELAFRLNLNKEEIELARIIGLLHDIGRFEQIKRFGKIDDINTKSDYALFGCNYLFDEHHINDFGIKEDSEEAKIIYKAISNHNKYKIEDGLSGKELLFSKMIRDMDKIDIFRSMVVNCEMKFNADEITEDVLRQYSNNETILRELIKTSSDKTLSCLSFIYDINFNESFDILVETDNFDLFLGMVEVNSNSEKLWKKLRELAFDKINRGVENDK